MTLQASRGKARRSHCVFVPPNGIGLTTILSSKAIDPRAACSVMVESAHTLKKKGIKNKIYFVGLVREEVGSLGSQYLAGNLKPDYAIVIDMWFGDDPSIPKTLARPLDGGPVIFRFIRSINDGMISIAHPTVVQALSKTAEELVTLTPTGQSPRVTMTFLAFNRLGLM